MLQLVDKDTQAFQEIMKAFQLPKESEDDKLKRKRSLEWMKECWNNLEFICPGIHLAQIHPHLPWHQKELSLAFKDWLPKLKEIK